MIVILVDVHEQHVSKDAAKHLNHFVCLWMMRGGHFVNAVTQAHKVFRHIRCEITFETAAQDACGIVPKYDVVEQEIVDLRCGTGGKNLCFGKPSEIAYGNNK